MTDLTSDFNDLLKAREAPPTRRNYDINNLNEFLKEAYRISTLISRLHTDLLSIRQPYLSTAAPRRTAHLRSSSHSSPQYLTDRDREEIDANAKSTLRDLNASIRSLSDAEQLRRETSSALLKKKYASRFGVKWASGGGLSPTSKLPAQVADEDAANQTAAHREAVLWYLRQRLGEVGRTQASMMETRLTREMEKNRSVLAKARGGMGVGVNDFPSMGGDNGGESVVGGRRRSVRGLPPGEEEETGRQPQQYDLTEEQRQMFEKGNQDMLKHYESTLDKVRTAEKSLVEISELQTLLVNNLTTQSAHIDQLVADSFKTTENVGGGNKQLKKAAQRPSSARYTFFAASGLCAFLIIWDLLI